MNFNEERLKVISDAKIALKQLSKLLLQNIDLSALDPEKAKQAADGKVAAFEASMKLLNSIEHQLEHMK